MNDLYWNEFDQYYQYILAKYGNKVTVIKIVN